MDIRRLDPRDPVDAAQWYAALRAGTSAGLVAPFVAGEQALLTSLRSNDSNPYADRRAYGAWEGSRCLGTMMLDLPRRDNTQVARVDVNVLPPARRRGIGAALFDLAIAVARAEDRTVIEGEVNVVQGLALPDSPGGRFVTGRGFTSPHTEQRLLLEVPVAEAKLRELERAARERAGGYRSTTWTGLPPKEWLDQYARMHTLMQRDVPTGDLDREPVVYDADRILASQGRLLEQGYGLVTAMVLDPSDNPSAYTTMFVTGGSGVDVVQDNTFVLRAHRGRRLGTLAKVANLRQLAEHYPQARHVHTWAAPTNDSMRSVNERVGFRAVETMYEIELVLAQPEGPSG